MAILIEPPATWNNLQNKPIILSDNQISWDEIQGIPPRISFLATTPGQSYSPWVLSDYYGQKLEWLELTVNTTPYTMVQRNANGRVNATTFLATALPTSAGTLSAGNFYRDSNGFVKVVI